MVMILTYPESDLTPARITANIVGLMLFVQVVLGGMAVFGFLDVIYHIIWGAITFVFLIATTAFAGRRYGSKSTLFKIGAAALADFIVQIILGFMSLGSDAVVVVHLTNAFLLGVLVTYLISYADSADKLPAMGLGTAPIPKA